MLQTIDSIDDGKVLLKGGLLGHLFAVPGNRKNTDLAAEIILDPLSHLYLNDHVISGKPVLPATFALELICEAAASLMVDADVYSVENFHVYGGIVFDRTPKHVMVQIGKPKKLSSSVYSVDAELWSKLQVSAHFSRNILALRSN